MRYQFNAMGFDERVRAGELGIQVFSRDPPDAAFEDLQMFESQTIQYIDKASGETLAECHRYVVTGGRASGELGGSGRPDPKWLLVGDEEWNIAHEDDETCPDCATWRRRALELR